MMLEQGFSVIASESVCGSPFAAYSISRTDGQVRKAAGVWVKEGKTSAHSVPSDGGSWASRRNTQIVV